MTAVEILREARALIESPDRWTQGAYARTAAGTETDPSARDAAQWCALGAICHAGDGSVNTQDAIALLKGATYQSVTVLNDEDGHADVLAMFDRAIQCAS